MKDFNDKIKAMSGIISNAVKLPKLDTSILNVKPADMYIKPIDYSSMFSKVEMPEITPVGEVLESITKRQDEQIAKQNEVIENQNQQILELQNIALKKDEEIKELKDLNMKKSAEFYEMELSAKKERKKWWITTGLAIAALVVAIVGVIVAIVK